MAANGQVLSGAGEDPIITPPLYGTWPALAKRLLFKPDGQDLANRQNWVHKLNLDPRHRVTAGFGTRVIQQNQEQYMNAAWNQIGAVLEANRQIRLAQLARHASYVWYSKHLAPIYNHDPGRMLLLTAPVFNRIVTNGLTLQYRLSQSVTSPALTSVVTRRVARPGGRFARLSTGTPFSAGTLVSRLAAGNLSAAPPRTVASGTVTLQKLVDLLPASRQALSQTIELHAGSRRGATLTALRRSPNFKIARPGPGAPVPTTLGGADNTEAARFKTAIRESYTLLDTSESSAATVQPFNVGDVASRAFQALDPNTTIKARLRQRVPLPDKIRAEIGNDLVEVLAYPVIDEPMYKPLKDISSELLLPNINLIPPNSVTLLETNPPFIEAYMVGLNHEFARELLWREYPTDQRGSSFRQFWDVTEQLAAASGDPELAKEKLRDITKIHTWAPVSVLGAHNNRHPAGNSGIVTDLVLVIRG